MTAPATHLPLETARHIAANAALYANRPALRRMAWAALKTHAGQTHRLHPPAPLVRTLEEACARAAARVRDIVAEREARS